MFSVISLRAKSRWYLKFPKQFILKIWSSSACCMLCLNPPSFPQASCGGGGGVHSLLNLSSNVDSHVPACYLSQSFTTFFQGFLLFALMSSGILIFDHVTWIMKWNDALNEFHSLTNACCCMLSHFSRVRLFVTLWTVACRAPLSMGFSRQGYWNDLPFPSPREPLSKAS